MNAQLQRPTRVTRAWERLDRAVNRLDAALAAQLKRAESTESGMRQALDGARTENLALRDAAGTISRRLDMVMTRLRDAIAE
ncbi:MAG: hypothetical protein H7841_05740 [Magnetospirillum sp. WYHS-4]